MTYPSTRLWFTGSVVAATALVLTACTSSGDKAGSATNTPSTVSASQTTTEAADKKLTAKAQAALAAVHNGKLVESGAERVTDGIHTEPSLGQGRTYRLKLACAGTGTARLTLTPASVGTKNKVPCDQSVVQQRITVHQPVRIDVEGTKGATGVVAWEIDTL
ncbi:hypothetical protein [Streptomyces sp. NPDC053069]|uniref:hypothetical protein n=1 Tax=Streptomyces sp. NPDC053069 TaxID=3365695 RepID=UPI0037D6B8CF